MLRGHPAQTATLHDVPSLLAAVAEDVEGDDFAPRLTLLGRTPLAAPLHAIESSTALDPVVAVGDRVSGAIVADDLRRQVLQGAWLGHALHPLLVEVPMGTWMSATLLDLAGDDASRDGARLLTGVGVLAAVPAALSGWSEYAETDTRSRRVGVVHAIANGVLIRYSSAKPPTATGKQDRFLS